MQAIAGELIGLHGMYSMLSIENCLDTIKYHHILTI